MLFAQWIARGRSGSIHAKPEGEHPRLAAAVGQDTAGRYPMTSSNDPEQGRDEVTEINVAGTNCPWCFNDALDAVRGLEGVTKVSSSITGECIQVAHRGIDVLVVLDTLRATLHGVESSGYGSRMTPIDPMPTEPRCSHGKIRPQEHPRAADRQRDD